MPVHLYGQMADMRALGVLAARRGLASSRTPARRTARAATASRAGAAGVAGAFSFYPAKNLGAFGDAGALVTDDAGARRDACARCASTASAQKYQHDVDGLHGSARHDPGARAAAQAAAARRLERASAARRRRSTPRRSTGVGDLELPPVAAGSEPVWHLYVVRTARPRRARRSPRGARASAPAGTTRSRSHLSPAYRAPRPPRRRLPGRRAARRTSASRCRSSRASRERAARAGRRGRRGLLPQWLTARRTTRRTG